MRSRSPSVMPEPPEAHPLSELVPDVQAVGYFVRSGGAIYIPAIMMHTPGQGDGARFLDALPDDETIKFPNVISERLERMLLRRGYRRTREWSAEFEEWVEVFVRPSLK